MQLPTLAPEEVRRARMLKPDPKPDLCNGLNSLGNQSLLWKSRWQPGKPGGTLEKTTWQWKRPLQEGVASYPSHWRHADPKKGPVNNYKAWMVDDGQIRMELIVMNAMVNPNEKILQKCIFRWDKMTSIHTCIRERSWVGADSTVGGGTARTRWKKLNILGKIMFEECKERL